MIRLSSVDSRFRESRSLGHRTDNQTPHGRVLNVPASPPHRADKRARQPRHSRHERAATAGVVVKSQFDAIHAPLVHPPANRIIAKLVRRAVVRRSH
ncbi:hypothetical protein WCU98_24455, partial [Pectobacterium parmentieri]|uniref:hypothetical protein n=1 Tax=Pectobacterium parmentieri TaxID=1905730 RepID=UPI003019259E